MSQLVETDRALATLAVRVAERATVLEYFVTATAPEGTAAEAGAERLFAELGDLLARSGIRPLQEKIYGLGRVRRPVLAARERAFCARGVDAASPFTYLEGAPAAGGDFAGVQLWGAAPVGSQLPDLATVTAAGCAARRWLTPTMRLLYLPCVRGVASDGRLPDCPTGQARRMFANVGAALAAHGFSWRDVVRTWIYMPRLLDWYGEFNRVRTAHYASEGLGSGEGPEKAFPASTGIQGRNGPGEECFVDVLAVEPGRQPGTAVRPIGATRRQGSAFRYGSAFSRGMALDADGWTTVLISGTASIDPAGRSLYVDDAEAQCVQTLLNLAALLEAEQSGLHDIVSATVFCKDGEALEAIRRSTRLLEVPAFPALYLKADVCRPELRVEIDAVAAIRTKR